MMPKWDDKMARDFDNLRNKPTYSRAEVDALLKSTVRTFEDKIVTLERKIQFARKVPRWVTVTDPEWVGTFGLPLTNADWDDDTFSTTAKTLLNLNLIFGVPPYVRMVLARVHAHDAGSASGEYFVILSPNNTAGSGIYWDCPRSGNDHDIHIEQVVPCDPEGNIFYQIEASGAGAMHIQLAIFGYYI